jgi:DNA-binding CsgD family transcriptional regulator
MVPVGGVIAVSLQRAEVLERYGRLRPREVEIFWLASEGRENRQIAETLFLSQSAVKNYLTTIFRVFDIGTPPDGANRRSMLAPIATEVDAAGLRPPEPAPAPAPPVPAPTTPTPVMMAPPAVRRRWRWPWIAGAAVGLAVIASAAILLIVYLSSPPAIELTDVPARGARVETTSDCIARFEGQVSGGFPLLGSRTVTLEVYARDQWFPQNGVETPRSDGGFTLTGYLAGQGEHNRHAIRATARERLGPLSRNAVTEARDVVRANDCEDPSSP